VKKKELKKLLGKYRVTAAYFLVPGLKELRRKPVIMILLSCWIKNMTGMI